MTVLASGKRIPSDAVLYAAGRQGATDGLDLAAAGLEADARGRIAVDAEYRTAQPHIFAAGDVIGFPGLAATSMEQGRLAALAAFDAAGAPAAATCSRTASTRSPRSRTSAAPSAELTEAAVPYVRGLARYRELTRGEIAGDRTGLLKLLVHAETRRLLGVHVFGTAATELVHLGQTVMAGRPARRLPRRRRLQRPDVRRRVQGRRAGRRQPAGRDRRRPRLGGGVAPPPDGLRTRRAPAPASRSSCSSAAPSASGRPGRRARGARRSARS